MTTYFENFKTINELLDTMDSRKQNDIFKDKKDSERQSDYISKWTESDSYAETLDLITRGYKKPLEQLKQGIAKSQKLMAYQKKRPVNSYAGFKPNIPNYLAGHPLTMKDKKNVTLKSKMVHLVYGYTATGSVGSAELIEAGILFLSLVNQLEIEGYRVKLDVLFCSVTGSSTVGYTVNIKEYGQPMNLLKLCYPIVHPSMLRRTCFKWLETLPIKKTKDTSGYKDGYGTPLVCKMGMDGKRELEYLKDKGLVNKEAFYANYYQASGCRTVDELKKEIGLN